MASQGRHEVGDERAPSGGHVVALDQRDEHLALLAGLDQPDTLGTVALQAGPLLGHDDVDQPRLDVGHHPLKARALAAPGSGDVVVLVDLHHRVAAPDGELLGVLTVPVYSQPGLLTV